MKNSGYLNALIALLCLSVLMTLTSCQGAEHQSDHFAAQPGESAEDFKKEGIKADTEDSEVIEENAPETPNLPETQETGIPQESQESQKDFRAQYIGRTVGDVVQDLGDEYVVDYYEGSTMICYPDGLWFLFGSTEDAITDDLIIRQMISWEQYPAVYELTGCMTYPEIVDAVQGEVEIPQPDYYYSLVDEEWEYTLAFTYHEYCVSYTWLDDPETTPSIFMWVWKQDVEFLKLDDPPESPAPPGEPDFDSEPPEPEDEGELFCGPGWFEGVMGSKFYVPDGFIQQDFTPALGHDYLFENAELDMSISVHEMTFMMLGVDSSTMVDEYASREADGSVTYATSGNDFYVVSGYYDPEGDSTIYYSRVDYDDTFRYEVEFLYPSSQAEKGEEVLLEFLKNYSIS